MYIIHKIIKYVSVKYIIILQISKIPEYRILDTTCKAHLNFGFSLFFLLPPDSWRVKVLASHSRTSGGTASGSTSDNSSSSSAALLARARQRSV